MQPLPLVIDCLTQECSRPACSLKLGHCVVQLTDGFYWNLAAKLQLRWRVLYNFSLPHPLLLLLHKRLLSINDVFLNLHFRLCFEGNSVQHFY